MVYNTVGLTISQNDVFAKSFENKWQETSVLDCFERSSFFSFTRFEPNNKNQKEENMKKQSFTLIELLVS